jgi:ferredoxin-thioredoxin reductase catalytic subunit
MATAKSATVPATVPAKKVESMVKKEISALKADTERLSAFLKSMQAGPEKFSIKVCDCCIKIS